MRICVLARGVPDENSPMNGRYEWGHAVLLRRLGYTVTFVAVDLRVGKGKRDETKRRYVKDGVLVFRFRIPLGAVRRSLQGLVRLAAIKRTYREMEREGILPDLTWAYFGRTMGAIAQKLEEAFGVPYVVSEYESRLLYEKVPVSERMKLTSVYQGARALFAPNPSFCNGLKMRYGADFSCLPPAVTPLGARVAHDGFVFLSVGALTVEKGMDVVIRAYSKVAKACENTRLVIVGKGDEKRALEEQTESLGVRDKVAFLMAEDGDELRRIFSAADCFVSGSRKEWYGTLVSAVLSEGLPVLTTDCFAPAGVVTKAVGRIVPVDDAMSLSVCMAEACARPSPYVREEIRRFAENRFSVRAVGETIERKLSGVESSRRDKDM